MVCRWDRRLPCSLRRVIVIKLTHEGFHFAALGQEGLAEFSQRGLDLNVPTNFQLANFCNKAPNLEGTL